MRILGIETSTEVGSLALVEKGEVVERGTIDTYLSHSARLIPLLDDLLKMAKWGIEDLEGVGVGLGPGSFTGIRVGLAIAQGIASGLKIPICGVASFEALASNPSCPGGKICVISDARRGGIYAALYQKSKNLLRELKPPRIISPDEVYEFARQARIMSPHLDRLRPLLEKARGDKAVSGGVKSFPKAEYIALIAEERLRDNPATATEEITPIYLSDYTKRKNKRVVE